jgi:putative toxin-antitoxin system antitoxin component (TIGR02293 family)
MLNSVL